MSRDGEAYMPPNLIQRVLESAPGNVVLVGGQALAYWMGRYNIHSRSSLPAISRDVDFFTPDPANSEALKAFARAIHGRAHVLDERAISALIGSAIAPADGDRIYNVDLLHAIVGIERADVDADAIEVTLGDGKTRLRVMHPFDVLQSRNANLHLLAEKQDDVGQLQFSLAIEVARAFIEEQLDEIGLDATQAEKSKERAAFDLIAAVFNHASEDSARKNAERYGIFLADAIPAWRITAPVFWEKQWPHLRERMSPAYANACEKRAKGQ